MGEPGLTPERRADLRQVAGFAAAGLAAALVEPRGPRSELALGGRRVPSLCLWTRLTGHRCPACGMTRGLVYMFRGRPISALRAHLLAPFVFGTTALATLRSARRLARPAAG